MTIKNRAAVALDRTHFTNKGIQTASVREFLAAYLVGRKHFAIFQDHVGIDD